MPSGSLSCAEVAGPMSPEKPAVPVPARMVKTPEEFKRKTRLFCESVKYTLPELSTAMAGGVPSGVCVAVGPNEKDQLLPATVFTKS